MYSQSFRFANLATSVLFSFVCLAACSPSIARPLEETQISPEQARIQLDFPFLSRLKTFRTTFELAGGKMKFESARWAAEDGRIEVIFGETTPHGRFEWIDLKRELRGFRYFSGSDITLTWRESGRIESPVGPIEVQLLNATYGETLAKCGGFLVIWKGQRHWLSGFFCDTTGPNMTVDRMRELLSGLSVKGVADSFAK